ncbi:MAG: hypothetical protein ABI571_01210, partial [Actinomycetota bacterium]
APDSDVPLPAGNPTATSTPDVEPTEAAVASCETFPLPFEPGYLPPGFSNTVKESGGGYNDKPDDWIFRAYTAHYEGPSEDIHISFGRAEQVGVTIDGQPTEIMKRPATFGEVADGWGATFQVRGCGSWIMAANGISAEEAYRVAESLLFFEPESFADDELAGVWPILPGDTANCDEEPADSPLRGGASTAKAFAQQFLEWTDPGAIFAREDGNRYNHYLLVRLTTPESDLVVYVDHPVRDGCWVVSSASPPAAARTAGGVGISVRGSQITAGVRTLGADEVEWRLLFPDREVATTTASGDLKYENPGGAPTTEWVLIAILRRDGQPFSLWTFPVPPGDFAAG